MTPFYFTEDSSQLFDGDLAIISSRFSDEVNDLECCLTVLREFYTLYEVWSLKDDFVVSKILFSKTFNLWLEASIR